MWCACHCRRAPRAHRLHVRIGCPGMVSAFARSPSLWCGYPRLCACARSLGPTLQYACGGAAVTRLPTCTGQHMCVWGGRSAPAWHMCARAMRLCRHVVLHVACTARTETVPSLGGGRRQLTGTATRATDGVHAHRPDACQVGVRRGGHAAICRTHTRAGRTGLVGIARGGGRVAHGNEANDLGNGPGGNGGWV